MKTSELVEDLRQFGKVNKMDSYMYLTDSNGDYICEIGTDKMFQFDTRCTAFLRFNLIDQGALFRILYAYAATPLDQREDEPRFKVHLWPGENFYVNRRYSRAVLNDDDDDIDGYQTVFTKSQYEDFRKRCSDLSPYLPPFDKDDPRFEMVKDGDEK